MDVEMKIAPRRFHFCIFYGTAPSVWNWRSPCSEGSITAPHVCLLPSKFSVSLSSLLKKVLWEQFRRLLHLPSLNFLEFAKSSPVILIFLTYPWIPPYAFFYCRLLWKLRLHFASIFPAGVTAKHLSSRYQRREKASSSAHCLGVCLAT